MSAHDGGATTRSTPAGPTGTPGTGRAGTGRAGTGRGRTGAGGARTATGRPAARAAGAWWASLGTAERVAVALALVTVLVQISYPLLDGTALTAATTGSVVTFAAASVVGAAALGGARAALALLVVAGGLGLVAEAVGVATGVPFGDYRYNGTLGPQLLGVPVVVPLAWTMMAWPTHLAGRAVGRAVARRTGARRPALVAVPAAALALAGWDLFLDPMMVAAGHWTWSDPDPALPGVPGIPLSNYAGWLLVALVLQTALHLVLPRSPDPAAGGPGAAGAATGGSGAATGGSGAATGDAARTAWTRRLPPHALLLGWTWLGSTLANAAFFGRPAAALWGFALMGVVVGPYLLLLRRGRP